MTPGSAPPQPEPEGDPWWPYLTAVVVLAVPAVIALALILVR